MPLLLLICGAIVFVLALAYAIWLSRKPRELEERFERLVEGEGATDIVEVEGVKGVRPAVRFPLQRLSQMLSKFGWAKRYELKLIAAGIPLRGGEFASIVIVSLIMLATISWLVSKNPLVALGAALVGWWLPHAYLNWRYVSRRTLLENQLADALTVMSAAIGAGFGFIQSMRLAAEQLPPPISDELERVVRLSSMGMPTEQALQQLALRVQSYDYDMTVTAMVIQLRRGGNLTRLLNTIAETIRQRIDLRGEISAATAQARLSGWVLIALPIVVGGIASILNWDYMQRLFMTPQGQTLLKLVIGWQLLGIIWIRQLLKLEL
ncbi:MAG: type II secretion system F family protein [Armatimonadota bacterium]|nr:type II secretion system F family protein [Armatimonadota bacterium]MCX7776756.1 type II secretion system F family protein [Armatimonadota bacterium]MDW8024554.1 type II secretion system F family protein [Armatimonadota bacterium]